MSTDCVFSGRKGAYTEDDPPDPDDLYGRSKLLGLVDYDACQFHVNR
jgi:dTDP-4-dehydrorhamnose reductase